MRTIKFLLSVVIVMAAASVSCSQSPKFDVNIVKEMGQKNPSELTDDDFRVLVDQFSAAIDEVKAAKLDDLDTQQQQEWLKTHDELAGCVIAIPMIFYSAESCGNTPPDDILERLNELTDEMKGGI